MRLRDVAEEGARPGYRSLDKATTVDPNHHSPPKSSGQINIRTVKARVSALVWELRFFDVTTIGQPDDPRVAALAGKLNTALADIFGRDSREYKECSVPSFHSIPPAPDSEYSLSELRQSYQRGINRAIQNLGLLLDDIDRKLEVSVGVTRIAMRAQDEAGAPEGAKVSLVTMRAKFKGRPAPSTNVSAVSPGDATPGKRKPRFGVDADKVVGLRIVPSKTSTEPKKESSAPASGKSSKKKSQPKAAKAGRAPKKRKQEASASEGPESPILKHIEEALKYRHAGGSDQENQDAPAYEDPSVFQPLIEGPQETMLSSPGMETAPDASTEPIVDQSVAAMLPDAGPPEVAVPPVADSLPLEPLQEGPPLPEDGPSADGAAAYADEPHRLDELLSVEDWAGKLTRQEAEDQPDASRGELPAAPSEQARESAWASHPDLGNIEALADRFAEGLAGLSKQGRVEAPEEPCPPGAILAPAELDQPREEASPAPAESPVEPHPEPTAKPTEVEQNPFAIKDFEKKQSRPKITGAAGLKSQISLIMARIDDLKGFDVTGVMERFDLKARELREAVNNTIAEVFGRNTRAYWHHSLPSFDAIPVVLGSPKPSPAEVRDFYQHGIDKAVKKLFAIVETLKERLDQMESRDFSRSASPAPKREA